LPARQQFRTPRTIVGTPLARRLEAAQSKDLIKRTWGPAAHEQAHRHHRHVEAERSSSFPFGRRKYEKNACVYGRTVSGNRSSGLRRGRRRWRRWRYRQRRWRSERVRYRRRGQFSRLDRKRPPWTRYDGDKHGTNESLGTPAQWQYWKSQPNRCRGKTGQAAYRWPVGLIAACGQPG
jgi:hypothetical protein